MSDTFQAGDTSTQSGTQGSSFSDQGGSQDQAPAGGSGDNTAVSISAEDFAKLQKRLDDSQNFIDTLKNERAEDRKIIDELQARSTPDVTEIMDAIDRSQNPTSDQTVDSDELVNKVYARVEESLTAKQKEAAYQTNFQSVAKALQEQFGEKADAKVNEVAAENDMSFEDVVEMAKSKPKLALRLLGITDKPQPTGSAPTGGSINTMAYNRQPEAPTRNMAQATTDAERIALYEAEFKRIVG